MDTSLKYYHYSTSHAVVIPWSSSGFSNPNTVSALKSMLASSVLVRGLVLMGLEHEAVPISEELDGLKQKVNLLSHLLEPRHVVLGDPSQQSRSPVRATSLLLGLL